MVKLQFHQLESTLCWQLPQHGSTNSRAMCLARVKDLFYNRYFVLTSMPSKNVVKIASLDYIYVQSM